MEHFDLELHFGRPPKPVLRLRGEFRLVKNEPRVIQGIVSLVNVGRGVAREPMVAVDGAWSGLGALPLIVRAPHFYRPTAKNGPELPSECWSKPRVCVYPGHELEVFYFIDHLVERRGLPSESMALMITARIFAENMRPTTRQIHLSSGQHDRIETVPFILHDEPV